ncbi:uncharacterized protein MONOS_10942 [Monocercomonoides exilis]|uniref:uncharacterized protein n=1 Tax=Monocercomonoides exilis TaxID=2049356 RepID=UPI00355ABDB2|nr:hypothetical protein MONOS_10942 [Monocercomonoides exilis]|eukprot:MONOS_10942.1-p1 / transcript=MONOS_10942.1 / gene=MONOS_10942 / organism=Monocercomonoides_exilis_PA203 / gene_product=unspecified product / transcript_product=unspecified product / location=Mono_scaffold00520:31444-31968(-) / protein_length=110 / sequence_SO=supercontig / SO=protein_coding / is_pseudo=false
MTGEECKEVYSAGGESGKAAEVASERRERRGEAETSTVKLKELVLKKEGIPPDMQKIVFNDVQLSDMRTMSGCSIRNNEELKLMLRLQGGSTKVLGQMEKEKRFSARMAM